MQPSADSLHLGNYIGALVQLGPACRTSTTPSSSSPTCTRSPWPQDPADWPSRTRVTAAQYIAAGIDVGQVHALRPVPRARARAAGVGAELHHRLRRGVPDDPVQGQGPEAGRGRTPRVGLFTYPMLMAADILLYQTARCPGGRGPAPARGTDPQPGPAVQLPLRRDVHGAGGLHPQGVGQDLRPAEPHRQDVQDRRSRPRA